MKLGFKLNWHDNTIIVQIQLFLTTNLIFYADFYIFE